MKKKLDDYVIDASCENGYRYVGTYFCSKLSAEQRRKYGLGQMAGSVAVGLFILAMSFIDSIGNRTPYVVFPLEFVLVCIGYYVAGSYALYKSEDRMERKIYEKAYIHTVQAATIALILNAISLVGEVVIFLDNYSSLSGYWEHVFIVLQLVLLLIVFAVWKRHRHLYTLAYEEPKA